jgi:hypothetical protein
MLPVADVLHVAPPARRGPPTPFRAGTSTGDWRQSMATAPSHLYRDDLRYGARVLPSPEHQGLIDKPVNDLSMDDLEAYVELVTGENPSSLAPASYRPRRGSAVASAPR